MFRRRSLSPGPHRRGRASSRSPRAIGTVAARVYWNGFNFESKRAQAPELVRPFPCWSSSAPLFPIGQLAWRGVMGLQHRHLVNPEPFLRYPRRTRAEQSKFLGKDVESCTSIVLVQVHHECGEHERAIRIRCAGDIKPNDPAQQLTDRSTFLDVREVESSQAGSARQRRIHLRVRRCAPQSRLLDEEGGTRFDQALPLKIIPSKHDRQSTSRGRACLTPTRPAWRVNLRAQLGPPQRRGNDRADVHYGGDLVGGPGVERTRRRTGRPEWALTRSADANSVDYYVVADRARSTLGDPRPGTDMHDLHRMGEVDGSRCTT